MTGIEISETAIVLAEKFYGDDLKVYHGSVGDMPFDNELYDGIFCFGLIHLLNEAERIKLIKNCFNQLRLNGYMVFVAISKMDTKYGEGIEISKDTFETNHGVNLFFYDSDSVSDEFGKFGLIDSVEIQEPSKITGNNHPKKFCLITCKKEFPQ